MKKICLAIILAVCLGGDGGLLAFDESYYRDHVVSNIDTWGEAEREAFLEPHRALYRDFIANLGDNRPDLRVCENNLTYPDRVYFEDGTSTTDPEILYGHYLTLKYQCNFDFVDGKIRRKGE